MLGSAGSSRTSSVALMTTTNATQDTRWIRDAAIRHVRSWRFRVWMIILIGTAGWLAFQPLFHLLGFGFAFVIGIVVSVASLDLGSAFVRGLREHGDSRAKGATSHVDAGRPLGLMGSIIGHGIATHLALLVPPLAIICVNGVRVHNCDWGFGLQAYVLMPVLSCVGATMAGILVGLLCGRRRRLGNITPYAVFVLAVVYAVWRFYAAPPVFSYNLFGGYFPGNLYDESIEFRDPFYWARLYQFSVLGAMCAIVTLFLHGARLSLMPRAWSWTRQRVSTCVLAVLLATSALWLHTNAGNLRFDIDAEDIEQYLGGRYDTEHFVIYYPPGGTIERDIHLIAEDHEFRYAQVVRTLGVQPKKRITSYYFASPADKYEMMGAGRVYMAKPWRDEIYIHHQGFPHQVVRHEVTHVIAGVFGSPGFRVSADTWLGLPVVFNVGLIEGIAVAADWPGRPGRALTPHESVQAMIQLGMAPPVERILSTGFLAFSSARSYTMAGSLVKYLLDTEGAAKMRALYRSGGDFYGVYGKSQAEMIRGWRAMIDAIELPEDAAEVVRERFRRPGIFSRPCPHAIARQRARVARLKAYGSYDAAIELARRIVAQAPHEPRYQLELADVLVTSGDQAGAIAICQTIRHNDKQISSTLRAEATFELVSMAARAGDFQRVRELLADADALPLGEGEQRYIDAMEFAAHHKGPAGKPLRDYFWRYDPRFGADGAVAVGRAAAIVIAEPELGFGYYLLARNLRDRGVPGEVAATMTRALDLGLPSVLLEREAARVQASAGYRVGALSLVERAAGIMLEPHHPVVTQLFGVDWLERVQWKRHGHIP